MPSAAVGLDLEFVNFGMSLADHGRLLGGEGFSGFFARAYDVERSPREHAGYRVEVGSIGVTSQARGLERNLT